MIKTLAVCLLLLAVLAPQLAASTLPPNLRTRDGHPGRGLAARLAEMEQVEAVLIERPWWDWRMRPEYGPGSGRRGGVRLWRRPMGWARIEFRLGLDEFNLAPNLSPGERVALAQRDFAYPMLITDVFEERTEEEGGILDRVSQVVAAYRVIYVVVAFR